MLLHSRLQSYHTSLLATTWVALTRACTGICDRWLAVDCYNDSHCGLDNRSGGPLAGRYWVGLGQSSGFPPRPVGHTDNLALGGVRRGWL